MWPQIKITDLGRYYLIQTRFELTKTQQLQMHKGRADSRGTRNHDFSTLEIRNLKSVQLLIVCVTSP